MAVAISPVVAEIEAALVGHWSHFGRWPGGALVEEAGTLRYETPIPQLPYNGVIRTAIEGDAAAAVAAVLESFRRRQVSCLWWDHPSATPSDLGRLLTEHGLAVVEVASGMSLELSTAPSAEPETQGVQYVEVLDEDAMRAYSGIIFSYWEVPEEWQPLVADVNRHWGPESGPMHRWIAVDDSGRAIGKVMLSLAAPAGVAAIYGMSVRTEARGRGVASALTSLVLRRAKELGCARVVLHSSEMAVGVYERSGFVKQCELPVYANAILWANRHQ